jgi:4-hydroxy-tetrahydrodipicolinate reductase
MAELVMLDLVVSGATGRMGRALGRLITAADDLRAVGGIAPPLGADDEPVDGYPEIVDVPDAAPLLRSSSAVIDFSAPQQLRDLIESHGSALEGKALVVGTTGLDADLEARLDRLAATTAVLSAPNFSVGVNLLLGLVEKMAAALDAERYDVEVVETHHAGKEDAPSGTALALGRAVAAGRQVELEEVRRDGRVGRTGRRPTGEIAFHALRGGAVVGDHTVHFLGALDRLSITHAARDRDVFADGALTAARWLASREPGRYTMADVLGLAD